MNLSDTGMMIGAGVSLTLVGCCIFGALFRSFCMKPTMKPSRSDNDLTNMLERGESL